MTTLVKVKFIRQCNEIYIKQETRINIPEIHSLYQNFMDDLYKNADLFVPPGNFCRNQRLDMRMTLFRILFLDNFFKKTLR